MTFHKPVEKEHEVQSKSVDLKYGEFPKSQEKQLQNKKRRLETIYENIRKVFDKNVNHPLLNVWSTNPKNLNILDKNIQKDQTANVFEHIEAKDSGTPSQPQFHQKSNPESPENKIAKKLFVLSKKNDQYNLYSCTGEMKKSKSMNLSQFRKNINLNPIAMKIQRSLTSNLKHLAKIRYVQRQPYENSKNGSARKPKKLKTLYKIEAGGNK